MTDDDLTPPAKRNVKNLTAFLADLEAGDAVVATLATDRYGVFALRGTAVWSQVLGSFTIGGHPLDSNKKPQKALQLLRTFHSAEREEAGDAPAATPSDAASLTHGDLVRVVFAEEAYGEFDVRGVAVRSAVDDSLLVGGWIASTAGVTAPRVRSLTVVAEAGSHELGVPREISSWGNEAAADV
ncbi:hypothetical protein [Frondihabitans cladoniiphilus]|uniref:Uncharacterized protein n=1 Tax=Frondihabitans cladoniiphilus TaxID=715785 RepID=A0ABP8W9N2_9MICO